MELKITPNMGKLTDTITTTAAAKAAMMAAQLASPTLVKAAQRLFQAADLASAIFGEPFEDQWNPLLGYLTPRQVYEIQSRVLEMYPTRKNVFCIRITDPNPPGGLGVVDGKHIPGLFDLLAIDVSYQPQTITGEKVPVGSAVMDRVTGTESVDIQITTIDDEIGTIKRWFKAKCDQIVNGDGTFNPPAGYLFNMEIVHALPYDHGVDPVLPSEVVKAAFSDKFMVRAVSLQSELSRRDQSLQELQLNFTQFDTWAKAK